jgi:hypothetical protein
MPTTKLTMRKHIHSAKLAGTASNEKRDKPTQDALANTLADRKRQQAIELTFDYLLQDSVVFDALRSTS